MLGLQPNNLLFFHAFIFSHFQGLILLLRKKGKWAIWGYFTSVIFFKSAFKKKENFDWLTPLLWHDVKIHANMIFYGTKIDYRCNKMVNLSPFFVDFGQYTLNNLDYCSFQVIFMQIWDFMASKLIEEAPRLDFKALGKAQFMSNCHKWNCSDFKSCD